LPWRWYTQFSDTAIQLPSNPSYPELWRNNAFMYESSIYIWSPSPYRALERQRLLQGWPCD
jgi:hypothetical protein